MKRKIHSILKIFDVPAGVLMGIWTLEMIALTVYLSLRGKAFAEGSVLAYGTIVTLYAASKGYKLYMNSGDSNDSKD